MSFFDELKRRNVVRVGIAYGITTWVLLQIVDVISPLLDLPEWAPRLIFVFLAIGFFPALIFAWAFELTPEGLKREKEVDRTASITADTGRKLDFVIIGVLLVAVILLVADRFRTEPPEIIATTGEKSIAVLPFVNMSSDAEQEYFSDGITEEILNSLAAVKELKVAGRTSSFAFKGQNDDLRKIGDTLGVDHILEGSVRKSGATVRITAQLIQVDDGFHLWSDTYDRELTDVFAIQEEIATEILNQLKASLLDEEVEAFEPQRTDPEVYDLYLLARQRIYSRTQLTIQSAVELLDEAIQLDPTYAPAYAQRGIATMLLSDRTYGTIPEADAQRQGKRFIDRAIELDENLAEGWAGLGLYYANRPGEYELGVDALARALDLNPNMIDASNWLYVALAGMGDVSAQLDLIEDMTTRDPLYRPAFGNGVQVFNNFGQADKAQALIDRFAAYDPNDSQLLQSHALHLMYRGDVAEAFPIAERSIEQAPTDNVVRFVWSVALLQSLQIDRLAVEGQDFWQVDASDALGDRARASEIAYELEEDGYLDAMFILLNRSGRSSDLISYVDERWPSLGDFAQDYRGDGNGYPLMTELALAYSRTGDTERAAEALQLVDLEFENLSAQGLDNFPFYFEHAKYYALSGDHDLAFKLLNLAIDRGMQGYIPLTTWVPPFESLADDPRLAELEAKMLDNINDDRVSLGIEPIDPYTKFWQ